MIKVLNWAGKVNNSLSVSVLASFWMYERILAQMDFLNELKIAYCPCHCAIMTEFRFSIGHLQDNSIFLILHSPFRIISKI